MRSRQINCLNVAAAAAVALYYLCRSSVPGMTVRRNPEDRRPELLLAGAGNHVGLGSAIRSAAVFGWTRAFIEDRERIWFGLIPCSSATIRDVPEVTVITTQRTGLPLYKVDSHLGFHTSPPRGV
jgi:tRNA G18 (ribose-2'-O)-methylase SpoU